MKNSDRYHKCGLVGTNPDTRVNFRSIVLLLLIFSCSPLVNGQEFEEEGERYHATDAPPPLKTISSSEREKLSSSKNVRERTKSALELMELRLAKASMKTTAGDFPGVFTELGAFHALMDDTLSFLDRASRRTKDALNNLKRFEIGLRRLAPQLEILRREVPPERERYIFYLARDVREARAKAVEPLFADTVLQPRQQEQPE